MSILSDWFAVIYENDIFGIWSQGYRPIFTKLFVQGGYMNMGLIFIFIPIVLMAAFYFLWKYPYGRFWHWVVWLALILLIVFASTIGYANGFLAEYLLNPETKEFTSSIIRRYAWINTFLGMIIGFLFSLLFKQASKIQTHLPF